MNEYLETEREIKGYVEIEYSKIDNTVKIGTELMYPSPAPISQFYNYNNNKISQNYASLENDYFLLDGSFVLPYKPKENDEYYNENSGYITNETVEYLNDTFSIIEDKLNTDWINGITIYIKDNIPKNIIVKVTHQLYSDNVTDTYKIDNNLKNIIQVKFDYKISIKKIEIIFSDFEYKNRRFRMPKIDFGLSDLLSKDNGNLIKFDIIENIGELNLEFPSNQLTVELYDEEDKFNIDNPSGYADLLNQELAVKVKPYIGILTENNGIKYDENLAPFYLKDWQNNKQNITLNCVDYLEKLKTTTFAKRIGKCANYGNNENKNMLIGLDALFEQETEIEFDDFENFDDGINGDMYYDDSYLTTTTAFDYLTNFMIWVWGYIYCADKILVNRRDNNILYDKSLKLDNALLEEPVYTLKEPIKEINITQYSGSEKEELQTEVYYDSYLYYKDFDNLIVTFATRCDVRATFGVFENTWENVTQIDLKAWASALYESGTIDVFITAYYTSSKANLFKYDVNNVGKTIELTNKFFKKYPDEGSYASDLNKLCERLCNKIQQDYGKFDISIKYIGDPKIKPNMLVPIETRYGNKKVKVLKHTLTYNGGLTGTIEGVGD